MAYSDLQEKVNQVRMNNSVLLAEKYSQGNLFPRGSDERPYSKEPRAEGARKKRAYKKAQEEKKKLPSDADIQTKGNMEGQPTPEEVFGEDYEGGPTYLNTLLQIGGAIGGGVVPLLQQLLIRNPNAMALTFEEAGLGEGGYISTDKPNIYINSGAEAYILEPNGNFKFDGMYDPKKHGTTFPGLGLVQNQSNNNMKIAKLPHTPPTEKIALPNGKFIDSPLRFKTDQERIKFMEDFSRGYGRYSQTNTPMTIAQRGADGAHTNVKIYEEKDGYGNTNKKVLPYFGGTYGGPIRPKKV
tara:strand:+ start:597 stop:1490 length:894 start_codon:yes stop_codon:yes gene_type:complete